MATAKANKSAVKQVTFTAPLLRETNEDIKVGINGKNWVIKRGETVTIPDYVYEVIMESERMTAKRIKTINSMAENH